jgi:hypothetical protein
MILVVLVFVTTDQVAAVTRELSLGCKGLLLPAVQRVLDGYRWPTWSFHMRFDDVRNVKRPRASMADTHELVIARVKDDDSPIDSYGLRLNQDNLDHHLTFLILA